MKSVAALLFILAAAPIAHADNPDQNLVNDLIFHGVGPSGSVSQGQWEAEAIKAGHSVCTMLADGQTRSDILRREIKKPEDESTMTAVVDTALNDFGLNTNTESLAMKSIAALLITAAFIAAPLAHAESAGDQIC